MTVLYFVISDKIYHIKRSKINRFNRKGSKHEYAEQSVIVGTLSPVVASGAQV